MKKLTYLLGVAAVMLLLPTSMAFARDAHIGRHDSGGNGPGWGEAHRGDGDRRPFECNGTFSGISVRDLTVPASGVCLLTNSTINGHVEVSSNGDFEAGATSIGGAIDAWDAQTVYIYGGSTVGEDIETRETAQTQIFDSTVHGRINVDRGTDQVYLCHNVVGWGISVRQSGPDILVGGLNLDCQGNTVSQGNVSVADNATYVEMVVADNSVPNGSMFVTNNIGTEFGTSGGLVQGNQGGQSLVCVGNAAPFVGTPNPGWSQRVGQCSD